MAGHNVEVTASQFGSGLEIDVKPLYNYNEVKKALKDFDPELRKEMDKTIKGFIDPVAQIAKGLVPSRPLSGWRKRPNGKSKWSNKVAWDSTVVKRGISVRQGKRRPKGIPSSDSVTAWGIYNRSPAGSIYELAGKASAGHTPAGRTFVQALTERGHRPSRLIWRAWTEHGGGAAIQRDVIRTIEDFESQINHRI